MQDFPDRCPIIVEIIKDGVYETMKLLVTKTTPYAAFMCILRRRINLSPKEALFIILKCNNMMLMNNTTIGEAYEKYHDVQEKVLYLVARRENTFGTAIFRHFPVHRLLRTFYSKNQYNLERGRRKVLHTPDSVQDQTPPPSIRI